MEQNDEVEHTENLINNLLDPPSLGASFLGKSGTRFVVSNLEEVTTLARGLEERVVKLEELVAAQDKTIQDLKQQISYQLTKERQLARDLKNGKKRG